jgi:hypothetical protein
MQLKFVKLWAGAGQSLGVVEGLCWRGDESTMLKGAAFCETSVPLLNQAFDQR